VLHQAVVAAAAAEDVAEGGVIDLEDRTGVIAEVAQQAEVDLDALGDAAGLEALDGLGDAGDRAANGIAAGVAAADAMVSTGRSRFPPPSTTRSPGSDR